MHRPGARPTSRAAEPNLDTFPTSSSTATRLNSVVRETGEWPSVSDTTGHVRELCCKQVRHTARYYPIPPLTSCKDCSLSIPTTCSSGEPVKYPDTDTAPSRDPIVNHGSNQAYPLVPYPPPQRPPQPPSPLITDSTSGQHSRFPSPATSLPYNVTPHTNVSESSSLSSHIRRSSSLIGHDIELESRRASLRLSQHMSSALTTASSLSGSTTSSIPSSVPPGFTGRHRRQRSYHSFFERQSQPSQQQETQHNTYPQTSLQSSKSPNCHDEHHESTADFATPSLSWLFAYGCISYARIRKSCCGHRRRSICGTNQIHPDEAFSLLAEPINSTSEPFFASNLQFEDYFWQRTRMQSMLFACLFLAFWISFLVLDVYSSSPLAAPLDQAVSARIVGALLILATIAFANRRRNIFPWNAIFFTVLVPGLMQLDAFCRYGAFFAYPPLDDLDEARRFIYPRIILALCPRNLLYPRATFYGYESLSTWLYVTLYAMKVTLHHGATTQATLTMISAFGGFIGTGFAALAFEAYFRNSFNTREKRKANEVALDNLLRRMLPARIVARLKRTTSQQVDFAAITHVSELVNAHTNPMTPSKDPDGTGTTVSSDQRSPSLPREVSSTDDKFVSTAMWESFDSASILFVNLYKFDQWTVRLPPRELLTALNDIFVCLDLITCAMQPYGAYKVETIGGAYMVACGCPFRQRRHAEVLCDLALAFLQADFGEFQLCIGINSGPVVAGVIGVDYPRYRLMGDAVNTASRMSTLAKPGQICLSLDTAELLCAHSSADRAVLRRAKLIHAKLIRKRQNEIWHKLQTPKPLTDWKPKSKHAGQPATPKNDRSVNLAVPISRSSSANGTEVDPMPSTTSGHLSQKFLETSPNSSSSAAFESPVNDSKAQTTATGPQRPVVERPHSGRLSSDEANPSNPSLNYEAFPRSASMLAYLARQPQTPTHPGSAALYSKPRSATGARRQLRTFGSHNQPHPSTPQGETSPSALTVQPSHFSSSGTGSKPLTHRVSLRFSRESRDEDSDDDQNFDKSLVEFTEEALGVSIPASEDYLRTHGHLVQEYVTAAGFRLLSLGMVPVKGKGEMSIWQLVKREPNSRHRYAPRSLQDLAPMSVDQLLQCVDSITGDFLPEERQPLGTTAREAIEGTGKEDPCNESFMNALAEEYHSAHSFSRSQISSVSRVIDRHSIVKRLRAVLCSLPPTADVELALKSLDLKIQLLSKQSAGSYASSNSSGTGFASQPSDSLDMPRESLQHETCSSAAIRGVQAPLPAPTVVYSGQLPSEPMTGGSKHSPRTPPLPGGTAEKARPSSSASVLSPTHNAHSPTMAARPLTSVATAFITPEAVASILSPRLSAAQQASSTTAAIRAAAAAAASSDIPIPVAASTALSPEPNSNTIGEMSSIHGEIGSDHATQASFVQSSLHGRTSPFKTSLRTLQISTDLDSNVPGVNSLLSPVSMKQVPVTYSNQAGGNVPINAEVQSVASSQGITGSLANVLNTFRASVTLLPFSPTSSGQQPGRVASPTFNRPSASNWAQHRKLTSFDLFRTSRECEGDSSRDSPYDERRTESEAVTVGRYQTSAATVRTGVISHRCDTNPRESPVSSIASTQVGSSVLVRAEGNQGLSVHSSGVESDIVSSLPHHPVRMPSDRAILHAHRTGPAVMWSRELGKLHLSGSTTSGAVLPPAGPSSDEPMVHVVIPLGFPPNRAAPATASPHSQVEKIENSPTTEAVARLIQATSPLGMSSSLGSSPSLNSASPTAAAALATVVAVAVKTASTIPQNRLDSVTKSSEDDRSRSSVPSVDPGFRYLNSISGHWKRGGHFNGPNPVVAPRSVQDVAPSSSSQPSVAAPSNLSLFESVEDHIDSQPSDLGPGVEGNELARQPPTAKQTTSTSALRFPPMDLVTDMPTTDDDVPSQGPSATIRSFSTSAERVSTAHMRLHQITMSATQEPHRTTAGTSGYSPHASFTASISGRRSILAGNSTPLEPPADVSSARLHVSRPSGGTPYRSFQTSQPLQNENASSVSFSVSERSNATPSMRPAHVKLSHIPRSNTVTTAIHSHFGGMHESRADSTPSLSRTKVSEGGTSPLGEKPMRQDLPPLAFLTQVNSSGAHRRGLSNTTPPDGADTIVYDPLGHLTTTTDDVPQSHAGIPSSPALSLSALPSNHALTLSSVAQHLLSHATPVIGAGGVSVLVEPQRRPAADLGTSTKSDQANDGASDQNGAMLVGSASTDTENSWRTRVDIMADKLPDPAPGLVQDNNLDSYTSFNNTSRSQSAVAGSTLNALNPPEAQPVPTSSGFALGMGLKRLTNAARIQEEQWLRLQRRQIQTHHQGGEQPLDSEADSSCLQIDPIRDATAPNFPTEHSAMYQMLDLSSYPPEVANLYASLWIAAQQMVVQAIKVLATYVFDPDAELSISRPRILGQLMQNEADGSYFIYTLAKRDTDSGALQTLLSDPALLQALTGDGSPDGGLSLEVDDQGNIILHESVVMLAKQLPPDVVESWREQFWQDCLQELLDDFSASVRGICDYIYPIPQMSKEVSLPQSLQRSVPEEPSQTTGNAGDESAIAMHADSSSVETDAKSRAEFEAKRESLEKCLTEPFVYILDLVSVPMRTLPILPGMKLICEIGRSDAEVPGDEAGDGCTDAKLKPKTARLSVIHGTGANPRGTLLRTVTVDMAKLGDIEEGAGNTPGSKSSDVQTDDRPSFDASLPQQAEDEDELEQWDSIFAQGLPLNPMSIIHPLTLSFTTGDDPAKIREYRRRLQQAEMALAVQSQTQSSLRYGDSSFNGSRRSPTSPSSSLKAARNSNSQASAHRGRLTSPPPVVTLAPNVSGSLASKLRKQDITAPEPRRNKANTSSNRSSVSRKPSPYLGAVNNQGAVTSSASFMSNESGSATFPRSRTSERIISSEGSHQSSLRDKGTPSLSSTISEEDAALLAEITILLNSESLDGIDLRNTGLMGLQGSEEFVDYMAVDDSSSEHEALSDDDTSDFSFREPTTVCTDPDVADLQITTPYPRLTSLSAQQPVRTLGDAANRPHLARRAATNPNDALLYAEHISSVIDVPRQPAAPLHRLNNLERNDLSTAPSVPPGEELLSKDLELETERHSSEGLPKGTTLLNVNNATQLQAGHAVFVTSASSFDAFQSPPTPPSLPGPPSPVLTMPVEDTQSLGIQEHETNNIPDHQVIDAGTAAMDNDHAKQSNAQVNHSGESAALVKTDNNLPIVPAANSTNSLVAGDITRSASSEKLDQDDLEYEAVILPLPKLPSSLPTSTEEVYSNITPAHGLPKPTTGMPGGPPQGGREAAISVALPLPRRLSVAISPESGPDSKRHGDAPWHVRGYQGKPTDTEARTIQARSSTNSLLPASPGAGTSYRSSSYGSSPTSYPLSSSSSPSSASSAPSSSSCASCLGSAKFKRKRLMAEGISVSTARGLESAYSHISNTLLRVHTVLALTVYFIISFGGILASIVNRPQDTFAGIIGAILGIHCVAIGAAVCIGIFRTEYFSKHAQSIVFWSVLISNVCLITAMQLGEWLYSIAGMLTILTILFVDALHFNLRFPRVTILLGIHCIMYYAIAIFVTSHRYTGYPWVVVCGILIGATAYRHERLSRIEFVITTRMIQEEARTEHLLQQLLPLEVRSSLTGGTKDLIVHNIKCASVLFADVVGFTTISAQVQPPDLVLFLNVMFSAFDECARTHRVYKVETIGDAYLACSGVVKSLDMGQVLTDKDHARNLVNFGVDIIYHISFIRHPRQWAYARQGVLNDSLTLAIDTSNSESHEPIDKPVSSCTRPSSSNTTSSPATDMATGVTTGALPQPFVQFVNAPRRQICDNARSISASPASSVSSALTGPGTTLPPLPSPAHSISVTSLSQGFSEASPTKLNTANATTPKNDGDALRKTHTETVSSRTVQPLTSSSSTAPNPNEAADLAIRDRVRLRVGVHTGPVIAGVVGQAMPRYHLFGPTVTLAQSMESKGIPSRVVVSEMTYNLLKDEYAFDSRGSIEVGDATTQRYLFRGAKTMPSAFWIPADDKEPWPPLTVTSLGSM